MSNPNNRDEDKTIGAARVPQSWRQRHGAALLFVGFAVLIVLMVVMQKKSVH